VSYCQKREKLRIEISKDSSTTTESFSFYSVSITNFSDSITAILHSVHALLSVGNRPQELVVWENKGNKELYSLKQTVTDTLYTYEVPQYRASVILPFQKISFKILVPSSNKEKLLLIDYFYLIDFSYRKFTRETMIGWWYEKYHQLHKTTLLPK
jgi:hypothetical protein